MNIVMISTCDRADRLIIGRVLARWPATTVLRPTWRSPADARSRRVAEAARTPVISVRKAVQRANKRRRDHQLQPLLRDAISMRELAPEPIEAGELNRPAGIRRLQQLAPDVLVLSGAPILRDEILSVPTIGTVNVHFGISPEYRGEHTLFHALRRRDYDHLGLTLHRVDAGIDTGPMLAQAYPALHASDDEVSLYAKCAELGAEVLVEHLAAAEQIGELRGRPQTGRGQLYLRADRRVFRHDLVERVQRDVLGRRPPERASRIVHYDDPARRSVAG